MATKTHSLKESLKKGHMGELFFRHWLSGRIPSLSVNPVSLHDDRRGIDGVIRFDATVQVKWDEWTHESGNVCVETVSSLESEAPGWAVKCDARVFVYLCPGRGNVFWLGRNNMEFIRSQIPGWKKAYRVVRVPNEQDGRRWTTENILVPVEVWENEFWYDMSDDLRLYFRRRAST